MSTAEPTTRIEPGPGADRSVVLVDHFDADAAPGSLTDTVTPTGHRRLLTDVEGRIGADNGALRIQPLAQPGWGRCGIAYGPFERRAGRVLAVHALNGHNASQTWYHPETTRQRWRRRLGEARRLGRNRREHHYENFAVGWFASPAPKTPEHDGNGFVMHSASGDNGELWATIASSPLRVGTGIQNLEIVYAVVLRERGATYYASSITGSHALGAYPEFQPVAVDVAGDQPELYAGVHQRILGEVGYRVDTRVPWVSIVDDPSLAAWHGGALVADRLTQDTGADAGPAWSLGQQLLRTTSGLTTIGAGPGGSGAEPTGDPALGAAGVDAGRPIGLVHVAIEVSTPGDRAGVTFRGSGSGSWRCLVSTSACELARRGPEGSWEVLAVDTRHPAIGGRRHHLQVTDDGTTIGAHLDGQLLFEGWTTAPGPDGTGVGVVLAGTATVADFEAHARAVRLPVAVDRPGPWEPESGPSVVDQAFAEHHAERPIDLHGTASAEGGPTWLRVEGDGAIDLTSHGARVRADVANPNPGRTIYAFDWVDPTFADLELHLTPPGTAAGQGEECRAGLVLWQDEANYLVANIFLDNLFDGASISTFFRSRGHEDMHDAVWTLVRPVRFGEACSLRLVSDGHRFLSYLGDRPSLHRSFTDVYPDAPPLAINRVGIVINREWGDDTGTVLHRFTARRGPDQDPGHA